MSPRSLLASLALVPALIVPAPAIASPGTDHQRHAHRAQFDLQAHRGGIGLTTEESLEAFGKAMRLGVSTLELDTQISRDRKVVVTHDRQVSTQKCRDTVPVNTGRPAVPLRR